MTQFPPPPPVHPGPGPAGHHPGPPGWGQPGPGYPPPPKRGGNGALVVVLLLLLAGGGLGAFFLLGGDDDEGGNGGGGGGGADANSAEGVARAFVSAGLDGDCARVRELLTGDSSIEPEDVCGESLGDWHPSIGSVETVCEGEDTAVLTVSVSMDGGASENTLVLVRVDGTWRVHDNIGLDLGGDETSDACNGETSSEGDGGSPGTADPTLSPEETVQAWADASSNGQCATEYMTDDFSNFDCGEIFSQFPTIESHLVEETSTTAVVEVRISDDGGASGTTVVFALVREDGAWKVNDSY